MAEFPHLSICDPGIIPAMIHLGLLDPDTPLTIYRETRDSVYPDVIVDHESHECARLYGKPDTIVLPAGHYAPADASPCVECFDGFHAVAQPRSRESAQAAEWTSAWSYQLDQQPDATEHTPKWANDDPCALWRSGTHRFRHLATTRGAAAAAARKTIATTLAELAAAPVFRDSIRQRLLAIWVGAARGRMDSWAPDEFIDDLWVHWLDIDRDLNANNDARVNDWWDHVTSHTVWVKPGLQWTRISEMPVVPNPEHPRSQLLRIPTVAVKYHLPIHLRDELVVDVPPGTPDEVVYAAEELLGDTPDWARLGEYIAALTATTL